MKEHGRTHKPKDSIHLVKLIIKQYCHQHTLLSWPLKCHPQSFTFSCTTGKNEICHSFDERDHEKCTTGRCNTIEKELRDFSSLLRLVIGF